MLQHNFRHQCAAHYKRQARQARANRLPNAIATLAALLWIASFAVAWLTPTDANGHGDFSNATGLLCLAFAATALLVPHIARRN